MQLSQAGPSFHESLYYNDLTKNAVSLRNYILLLIMVMPIITLNYKFVKLCGNGHSMHFLIVNSPLMTVVQGITL